MATETNPILREFKMFADKYDIWGSIMLEAFKLADYVTAIRLDDPFVSETIAMCGFSGNLNATFWDDDENKDEKQWLDSHTTDDILFAIMYLVILSDIADKQGLSY